MLQRSEAPRLPIINSCLANFPTCECDQCKQRDQLRGPKNRTRIERRKRLSRCWPICQLIQNILRFCCRLSRGTRPACCSWGGGCWRCCSDICRRPRALDSDSDRFAPQRHILLFRWIEIRECENRQSLLLFVGRKHRLESFCATGTHFVVLLELRGGWIFVPTAFVFNHWRIDAVEIPSARDRTCDGDGIAHLHAFWVCIRCHCKIPNCA